MNSSTADNLKSIGFLGGIATLIGVLVFVLALGVNAQFDEIRATKLERLKLEGDARTISCERLCAGMGTEILQWLRISGSWGADNYMCSCVDGTQRYIR